VTEVGVVKVGVHGRCTEGVVDELALHGIAAASAGSGLVHTEGRL